MTDTLHMHPTQQHPLGYVTFDRCDHNTDVFKLIKEALDLYAVRQGRSWGGPGYPDGLVITVEYGAKTTISFWQAHK
jgi:hypothetical protein